jgi:iron complex outermembrane receptor protein
VGDSKGWPGLVCLGAVSGIVFNICSAESFAQTAGGKLSTTAGSNELPPVVVQSPTTKRTQRTAPRSNAANSRHSTGTRPGRQPSIASSEAATKGTMSGSPIEGYVAPTSVGATKTNTPLIQTPASVSVVTHQQIVDQNAQSVSQALRYTPGVVAEQRGINEDSLEYLYSRGFQASTFLDGLPIAPPTSTGTGVGFNFLTRDPYLLDRIESIRGPLSVLFGQVPPGGFFNLVSKQPTDTPYHEVFVQTGSYGRAQGGFDFSGPLTDDKQWLYRLTGIGLTTGTQTDYVDQQRIAVSPAITWRPDQDTKLTVIANYQNDPKAGAYDFVPAVGTVLPGPVKIGPSFETGDPGYDQYRKQETSVGYSFEHQLDSVWQVKQNFRYSYDESYIQHVGDGSVSTTGGTAINRDPYINSGTLGTVAVDNQAIARFNTGFLKHEVVLGVDYQNYQYNHRFLEGYTNDTALPALSLTNPIYFQSIAPPNFLLGTSTMQSTDQTGLYAQDQIGIGKLTIVGGLREDWSTSHIVSYKTSLASDQDNNSLTGRIGGIYNFDSGVAPYVSYATSFQPQLGTTAAGVAYTPTEGEQTEVGVKYQPKGTKNLFTVAAFDLTQTNVVVSLGGGASAQIGAVRSRGVEFEARTYLTDNLQAIASYTFDKVANVEGIPTTVGLIPNGIPRNMASAWLSYDMPTYIAPGLKISGGARYVDSTWDTTNSFKVPPFTLFDLGLQYDLGQQFANLKGYTAGLSVKNLFNKEYIASCINAAYCIYGQGRLVLADLKYRW